MDPAELNAENIAERIIRSCIPVRHVTVPIAAGTEQRIRAQIHRVNEDFARLGEPLSNPDEDRDFEVAVCALIDRGLDADEHDAGLQGHAWGDLTPLPKPTRRRWWRRAR